MLTFTSIHRCLHSTLGRSAETGQLHTLFHTHTSHSQLTHSCPLLLHNALLCFNLLLESDCESSLCAEITKEGWITVSIWLCGYKLFPHQRLKTWRLFSTNCTLCLSDDHDNLCVYAHACVSVYVCVCVFACLRVCVCQDCSCEKNVPSGWKKHLPTSTQEAQSGTGKERCVITEVLLSGLFSGDQRDPQSPVKSFFKCVFFLPYCKQGY